MDFTKQEVSEAIGQVSFASISDSLFDMLRQSAITRALALTCRKDFSDLDPFPDDLKLALENLTGFLLTYSRNVGSVNIASRTIEHTSFGLGNQGAINPQGFAALWYQVFARYSKCRHVGMASQSDLTWLQYSPDGMSIGDVAPDWPIGGSTV